jgi:prephenate dehydratase
MRVAFQGERGAYSDLAALHLFPASTRLACVSFEDALAQLDAGHVQYAVIPVQNSIAGPVTTSVALLKGKGYGVLHVHWQPIHHCLLALPGAGLELIKTAVSHWQALAQCKNNLAALGIAAVEEYDTAGAAKIVAQNGDNTRAAIASSLAAQEYGLQILRDNFADQPGNRTQFLALTRETGDAEAVHRVLKTLGLG